MSIYYFLFSKSAKETVCLGKKLVGYDREYEGPIVWISVKPFYLPPSMLNLLIERFFQFHGEGNAFLLDEGELFTPAYIDNDEEGIIQVGGDEDNSIPLTKYLPELDDENVRRSIQMDGRLSLP